jgi:predicted dehydrogenase
LGLKKDVTAIISADLNRAKDFATKKGISNYYSYQDVDFEKFDIVYVATLNKCHKPDSILFINNHKSVLCEKPIAVTLDELNEMRQSAKDNNTLLMEAMWTAFLPAIEKVKELIASGEIGKVVHLDSRFCIEVFDPKSRIYDSYGGGALLDVGIYNLHFAKLILDDFVEIKAFYQHNEAGVDMTDNLIIRNSKGISANLVSSVRFKAPADAVIYGEKGKITVPDFFKASEVILENQQGKKIFSYPPIISGYEYEIEHFEKLHIQGKKQSDIVSFDDSYEILKIMQKR